VNTELVDLYSCDEPLHIIIHPSLEQNQAYLDLILHTPFHRTISDVAVPLITTFADVAASAGNMELLKHLFESPDQCVRSFLAERYSFHDPKSILQLFVHALNSRSVEVVNYLVGKLGEQMMSDVKITVLEVCLWLATTDKTLEACFENLALTFGVNLMDNSDVYSPLRLCCMYDNGDAAGFLIDSGADMYNVNGEDCTVVYQAYKYGLHTFGKAKMLRVFDGFSPLYCNPELPVRLVHFKAIGRLGQIVFIGNVL
jgi:hypothetical protein